MTDSKVYATGRRKTSTARVWLSPGDGKIIVNKVSPDQYFKRPTSVMIMKQPLELTGLSTSVDIWLSVRGGGLSGQAGAARHGIARALQNFDQNLRAQLKKAGMITRDSRAKERMKPGRARARKRFQFSKR